MKEQKTAAWSVDYGIAILKGQLCESKGYKNKGVFCFYMKYYYLCSQ